MVETILDLRYNIAAITIAICSDNYMLPETAFSIIEENKFILNEDDLEDMIALNNQGVSYRKIGEIYGISNSHICNKIKRYRMKRGEAIV